MESFYYQAFLINTITYVESLNQEDIEKRFNNFWNEYVISSPELHLLQCQVDRHIHGMISNQTRIYRQHLMNGCLFAFKSNNIDSFECFEDLTEDWTDEKFKSIKVFMNEDYFIMDNGGPFSMFSLNFMPDLHSRFGKIINDNPQTKQGFESTVEESVIRDICLCFKISIDVIAANYGIESFLRPKFSITCVAFATFQMLLPRIMDNFIRSSSKNLLHHNLNEIKESYKNMFIFTLSSVRPQSFEKELCQNKVIRRMSL